MAARINSWYRLYIRVLLFVIVAYRKIHVYTVSGPMQLYRPTAIHMHRAYVYRSLSEVVGTFVEFVLRHASILQPCFRCWRQISRGVADKPSNRSMFVGLLLSKPNDAGCRMLLLVLLTEGRTATEITSVCQRVRSGTWPLPCCTDDRTWAYIVHTCVHTCTATDTRKKVLSCVSMYVQNRANACM